MGCPKGSKKPEGFNKGKNHPLYGKHHSTEHKKRLKESMIGRSNYWLIGKDSNNKKYKTIKERKKAESLRYKIKRDLIKKQVFEHYGLKCVCCGENIYEFLTLDHIGGGGQKHRKEVLGDKSHTNVPSYHKWIVKNNFPPLFQILCFNCNITKGLYGKCPHKNII